MNASLIEEALAMPTEERLKLAELLLESLQDDLVGDDEVRAKLVGRHHDLRSGADRGLSIEEVFGEPV